MMTQTRREILAVLSELFELDSDARVGQLMTFMGVMGEANAGRALYHLDDEELLDALCEHRNNLRNHQDGVATSRVITDTRMPTPSSSTVHSP